MSIAGSTVVHVEIEMDHCYGEVCVNGIPIFTNVVALHPFRQSIQVNPFVVPNLNVLELAVDIDPQGPSVSRRVREKKAPTGASATARLLRFPLQPGLPASAEHGEVLAMVRWTEAEDPFATSPKELRAFAELGEGYGPRVWQSATQLTLDQATRDEAVALLETIHSAMRAGDTRTLLDMLDLRLRDVAASYQGNLDQQRARSMFSDWIAGFGAEPDRVLPIEFDKLDFRLAAERRLLLPHTAAFESAIRVAVNHVQEGKIIGRAVVPYDVKFAKIDGYSRIVA